MSDEMNQYLAEFYGTTAHTQEDQEKTAQAELFAKLAAAEGVDLSTLSEDQVAYLWNQVFETEKTAAEHGHAHKHGHKKAAAAHGHADKGHGHKEEKDEKKAAAEEFAEKKAAAEKIAEADFLGRVMAHAYVQELTKIGEAEKNAAMPAALKAGLERVGKAGKSIKETAGKATGAVGKHLEQVGTSTAALGLKKNTPIKDLNKARQLMAKHPKTTGAAVYGGGAAAAGGAALAAKKLHDKKKESSAFDEKSAEVAIQLATENGWDGDEAAEKVAALLTLGLVESEKVAAAEDLETGLQIRALEMLETIGYPVTWNE